LPYLTLMREDAPQREYSLRDLFCIAQGSWESRCERLLW
jgi:hypothetical protein